MPSPIHSFRAALDAGRLCVGAGISLSDPAVTEALAPACDFFWIDLEHSPIGLEAMQAHLIAARATGTAALVRVPSAEVGWLKRVLDAGPDGIIVPQVRSAAEVEAIVANCRYAPLGNRGYGPRRAALYGQIAGDEYVAAANRDLFVTVQIENAEALADIDRIVAVPHLDSIVLGPWDLSFSLGYPGQVEHTAVNRAMRRIIDAGRSAGKYVGCGCGMNVGFARDVVKLGVQWVQLGGDMDYLQQSARSLFDQARG